MAELQPARVNSGATKQQQKHEEERHRSFSRKQARSLNRNPKGHVDQEQQHPLLPLL